MYVLRIEHHVADFAGWKRAFDSDPVGREQSGVRRHRVLRGVDDPNHVMIDLEFDDVGQAEALLAALHVLWSRVEGTVMTDPRSLIANVEESRDYRA